MAAAALCACLPNATAAVPAEVAHVAHDSQLAHGAAASTHDARHATCSPAIYASTSTRAVTGARGTYASDPGQHRLQFVPFAT